MPHTIATGTRDGVRQKVACIAEARNAGSVNQPGEMCGLSLFSEWRDLS